MPAMCSLKKIFIISAFAMFIITSIELSRANPDVSNVNEDITVRCECDKTENKWTTEKIPLEEAKMLFYNMSSGALGETRTLTS